MRPIRSLLFVLASVLLVAQAFAAARPRYGGTLRVQVRAQIASLHPADWSGHPAERATTEQVAALVLEPLVRINDRGEPEPVLVLAWQHDAAMKQWQFRLRPGVKLHDGTPLTPTGVVTALEQAGHGWVPSVFGESVLIQSPDPIPHLLSTLSRLFIFRRGADGAIYGTGPFRVAEWAAAPSDESGATLVRRLNLSANDDYWRGRPFLDRVEIEMGRAPREQAIALELGRADLVELPPDQVRRAITAGAGGNRAWSSAPTELLALTFDLRRPAAQDARLREALALAIDRAAIHSVLLQRQGEPAGALLPQWLSGYAFLFSTARDLERARALVAEMTPAPPALTLAYDSADSLARAIAERIATNARDAGLSCQLVGQAAQGSSVPADLTLIRYRIQTPRPLEALASMIWPLRLGGLNLMLGLSLEDHYRLERQVMDAYHVVPLLHLPVAYGLGPGVRNWAPGRWGDWRLEDVWLDRETR